MLHRVFVLLALAAFAADISPSPVANNRPAEEPAPASALCPIVYPLDSYTTTHGYRYTFFGNAFFINKDGYLITAAHVLQTFRDGGQPSILVDRPDAPSQLLQAMIVAIDWDHDVAILKATPNPFHGRYRVSFLPISPHPPDLGDSVVALALHPRDPRRASTYQSSVEDHSPGQVLDYEFTQEQKGAPDTEMLLFSHEVEHGQSGSPVLSASSREVVGIVDGRWLRSLGASAGSPGQAPTVPGAAVPIHYALNLLQNKGVAWQTAETLPGGSPKQISDTSQENLPVPLSLVGADFPSDSLLGGQVFLDATLGATGGVSGIQVVSGSSSVSQKASDAVRTWTFRSSHPGDPLANSHVGIAFKFVSSQPQHAEPQSGPPVGSLGHSANCAAIPVSTSSSVLALHSSRGMVFLIASLSSSGELTSARSWSGSSELSNSALAALSKWRFSPARRSGSPVPSTFVLVFIFRGTA